MLIKRILSLYDYTGVWCQPYRDAGYHVIQVDIRHGKDVRLLPFQGRVHGILAAPPCTHFALSGALHWERKGEAALHEGLALVDAVFRFVTLCKPEWWVMENPLGRLGNYIGPPRFSFDPHEYAGWADDPAFESYTKRTLLWGKFTIPRKKPRPPTRGTVVRNRWAGAYERFATPQGFSRAFFAANP